MKLKILIMIIASTVFINGCVTISSRNELDENGTLDIGNTKVIIEMNKYESEEKYQFTDKYKKAASTFVIKKDKKGDIWGELTSPLLANGVIIGSINKIDEESFEFIIEEIKYFASWPNGWTAGLSEAYGKLLFKKEKNGFSCTVIKTFELWEVQKGKIRYLEDYYLNKEGYKKVKNRVDRISVVVDFLKMKKLPDLFGHHRKKTVYGDSFKKTIGSYLFPERFMFSSLKKQNKLPEEYYKETDNLDDNKISKYVLGEDILWRKDYTEKVFPEYLHKLRNSGSMYRDFEESIHIYFMLYNLEYYFENILNNSTFIKKI